MNKTSENKCFSVGPSSNMCSVSRAAVSPSGMVVHVISFVAWALCVYVCAYTFHLKMNILLNIQNCWCSTLNTLRHNKAVCLSWLEIFRIFAYFSISETQFSWMNNKGYLLSLSEFAVKQFSWRILETLLQLFDLLIFKLATFTSFLHTVMLETNIDKICFFHILLSLFLFGFVL